MEDVKDYKKDIAEIRSMMERSSKFLSLSGWAGILVGLYALIGTYIAYNVYQFNPQNYLEANPNYALGQVIILATAILLCALITAVYISYRESEKRREKLWNPTSRKLAWDMAVPFAVGGVLISLLAVQNLTGLAAPLSLLFYGLSLFNAGKYTYSEIRTLGYLEIVLGLLALCFIPYSLLIWAMGFGLAHIIYGVYMYLKYQK